MQTYWIFLYSATAVSPGGIILSGTGHILITTDSDDVTPERMAVVENDIVQKEDTEGHVRPGTIKITITERYQLVSNKNYA